MNDLLVTCAYCGGYKLFSQGWHDCPQAQDALARLQTAVSGIQADMLKPGQRRLTSNEMKQREDRRHSMAVSIKLNGGGVKPAYE